MTEEQKREKYSKYACHELNYFLFRKDREFFDKVIKPHIANKKDKTFLDYYLIGADLTPYLEPWQFRRLNIVERILLARSIAKQHPSVARHVRERFNLLPPDIEKFNKLFDTALKGGWRWVTLANLPISRKYCAKFEKKG